MVKKLQALRAKKGFTLVELIVVIAIIGVLAAILIPTLSGVIESSRKRSAESTCQSIQNLAKTFSSTVTSKKGLNCTPSTTVDMDEEVASGENQYPTMAEYIARQIPEVKGSETKGAKVTLDTNGNVTEILYTEGVYTAKWTNDGGFAGAEKNASAAASFGGVTVTNGSVTVTAGSVSTATT